MDKEEVKIYLELKDWPPLDVLDEIVEEETFKIRDYFLRNPIVSVLFKSRIRRLVKLQEISNSYLKLPKSEEPFVTVFSEETSFLKLLAQYENELSRLKTAMASKYIAEPIISIAESMIELQNNFESNWLSLCKEKDIQPLEEKIKIADQISTGRVLNTIRNEGLDSALFDIRKEFTRVSLLVS